MQLCATSKIMQRITIYMLIALLPNSSSCWCTDSVVQHDSNFFARAMSSIPQFLRNFPKLRGGTGEHSSQDAAQDKMLAQLNEVFEKQLPKRFELGAILGHGAFSIVRAAIDTQTGEEVAAKAVMIPKTVNQPGYAELQDVYRVEAEVRILNMSDHPHIIKLLHFFPSAEGSVLVMERCRGGELFNWMQNLEVHSDGTRRWSHHIISEVFVARIIGQLLSAVEYLHARKIVHRDMKLENILLKDGFSPEKDMVLKIIDVGFGKMLTNDDDKMFSSCGSTYYVAPEVLQADRAAGRGYGKAVDVWSIGVIAFILLCTEPPFNGPDDAAVIHAVRKGTWHIPEHAALSKEASHFLHRTMTLDATQRPTATECLAHPWIRNALAAAPLGRSPSLQGHAALGGKEPASDASAAAAGVSPAPSHAVPPAAAGGAAARPPALHRCSSSATRSGFWIG